MWLFNMIYLTAKRDFKKQCLIWRMVSSPYQCVGLKINCPHKSKSDGFLKVLTILNTKSIEVICTITDWVSLWIFEAPTSTITVEVCNFEIMEEKHLYTARQCYRRVVLDVMRRTQCL